MMLINLKTFFVSFVLFCFSNALFADTQENLSVHVKKVDDKIEITVKNTSTTEVSVIDRLILGNGLPEDEGIKLIIIDNSKNCYVPIKANINKIPTYKLDNHALIENGEIKKSVRLQSLERIFRLKNGNYKLKAIFLNKIVSGNSLLTNRFESDWLDIKIKHSAYKETTKKEISGDLSRYSVEGFNICNK